VSRRPNRRPERRLQGRLGRPAELGGVGPAGDGHAQKGGGPV